MKKTKKLNILIILSTLMTVILLTVFGFSATNAITRSASADETEITFDMNDFKPYQLFDVNILNLTTDAVPENYFVAFEIFESEEKIVYLDYNYFIFQSWGDGSFFLYSNISLNAISIEEFTTVYTVSDNGKTYKIINLADFLQSERFLIMMSDLFYPSTEDIPYNYELIGSPAFVSFCKIDNQNNQEPVDTTPTEDNFFANVGNWFNETFSTESAIVGIVVLVIAFVVLRKILK